MRCAIAAPNLRSAITTARSNSPTRRSTRPPAPCTRHASWRKSSLTASGCSDPGSSGNLKRGRSPEALFHRHVDLDDEIVFLRRQRIREIIFDEQIARLQLALVEI